MIPKRSLSDISAPVSPPAPAPLPPEALKEGGAVSVKADFAETVSANWTAPVLKSQPERILERLQQFSRVTKLPETQDDTLATMQKRGLLAVSSGYAVVSEKGITYLVDFGMI